MSVLQIIPPPPPVGPPLLPPSSLTALSLPRAVFIIKGEPPLPPTTLTVPVPGPEKDETIKLHPESPSLICPLQLSSTPLQISCGAGWASWIQWPQVPSVWQIF